MNAYVAQKQLRKSILKKLFKEHYNKQFDDFFEGRDALLRELEEIFIEEYGVTFKCLAVDDLNTDGRKEARRILRELVEKI